MAGDVTIRRMQQGDADAVRELDGQILEGDRSTTWDLLVERYLEVSDLETLILPPWGCHVGEHDGEIVAFILAERQVPVYGLPAGARIVAMAVHPNMRRMGLGKQLVDATTTSPLRILNATSGIIPEPHSSMTRFTTLRVFTTMSTTTRILTKPLKYTRGC